MKITLPFFSFLFVCNLLSLCFAEVAASSVWIAPDNISKETTLVSFEETITIDKTFDKALFRITTPNAFFLFVNGTGVSLCDIPWYGETYDVARFLKTGENKICIELSTKDVFHNYKIPLLAFDCKVWNGDEMIMRFISSEHTSSGGKIKWIQEKPQDFWQYKNLSIFRKNCDISKPREASVAILLKDNANRFLEKIPISAKVKILSVKSEDKRKVFLKGQDWNGNVFYKGAMEVDIHNKTGEKEFFIPPLEKGIYKIAVDFDESFSQKRFTAFAILPPNEKRISSVFDTLNPIEENKFLHGVDFSYTDNPANLMALRDLHVNFLDVHIDPNYQFDNGDFDDLLAFCKKTRIRFTINNEAANWGEKSLDKNGNDRFNTNDGCHRWDVESNWILQAAQTGVFQGVVYDEAEHAQLCRSHYANQQAGLDKPYFVETKGMDLPQAYEAFLKAATDVVKYQKSNKSAMIVESVFPVLWHPLVRSGAILCPKLMKEDITPVVFATALGAAKQYKTPLWFSPDFWLLGFFPGHTQKDYISSLRMGYAAGVNCIYTEHMVILAPDKGSIYEITPYGEILQDFISNYVPNHPRNYTHLDYEPEIAIIRFPDSDWGQASCYYWDQLYGASNLKSTPETREWMQIWHILTNGVTHPDAVNTNSSVYKPDDWSFDIPSPPVAVYDHLVNYDTLNSVNIIFLCGIKISPETLKAVKRKVTEGVICFTVKRLCPEDVAKKAANNNSTCIEEGKGKWIILDDFTPSSFSPYKILPRKPGSLELKFKKKIISCKELMKY